MAKDCAVFLTDSDHDGDAVEFASMDAGRLLRHARQLVRARFVLATGPHRKDAVGALPGKAVPSVQCMPNLGFPVAVVRDQP